MAEEGARIAEVVEKLTNNQEARPLCDQVAALAYSLWEERGCPEGTPEEDWFRAEKELKAKR
jgi:hypothetical protein